MSAVEKAVPVELPVIGQAYGGGFVTGITRDPVTGNRYLNITASAEHELVGEWGKYGVKVEGADSFFDGRANTEAMAAAGSELAQKVLGLTIGGHSDWAIPARDQQEPQYRNLKPTIDSNYCWGRDGDNPHSAPVGLLYTEELPAQTAVEAFKAGGKQAFQPRAYWSSTQRSANLAFFMHFVDGYQYNHAKSGELRVRPVRSELIQ
ncbi:DUF1566 domain-containing protein [Pseudomonas qingdaonensis]|uniref:DUF1566 domain-containing protein n=1 Tax=Pseudomonas qingdaonensis TaxID=2056231 RepID=UPI0018C9E043|nr:DUF1566 domain-containing protein [Pseudomonas qingdaonensis]MBG8559191.1 DUF1566 domain-containing protein [Pseudomonas qingdaonensis]